MKSIRAILSLAAAATTAGAQTLAAKFVDSARVEIERASTTRDNAGLARVVVLLDRALIASPNDAYLLHYRGYAAYRQAVQCFITGNMPCAAAHNTPPEYGGGTDRAREMIKKAIDLFATDAPAPLAPAWGREEAANYLKLIEGEKKP